MKPELQLVIAKLIARAREAKTESRHSLRGLIGRDGISTPSRGPRLPNGKLCLNWHYWMACVSNHKLATRKVFAAIKATGIKLEGLR